MNGGPRGRKWTTPVGRTGARFGPYSARIPIDESGESGEADEPEEPQQVPLPEPVRPERPPAESLPSESDVLIRPYARTGGRTRPTHDLALEALISSAPHTRGSHLSREHRAIVNLCAQPRSVAEVAALLEIPLGVARVLLGDLATDGSVIVRRTPHRAPDLALMRRVLAGLHRL